MKRFLLPILALLMISMSVKAQTPETADSPNRKKVAVVLSGGGALGAIPITATTSQPCSAQWIGWNSSLTVAHRIDSH